jgi:hypothetical protein
MHKPTIVKDMKFKKGPKTNTVGWTHASVSATTSPDVPTTVAAETIWLVASDSDETSIMDRDDNDDDVDDRIPCREVVDLLATRAGGLVERINNDETPPAIVSQQKTAETCQPVLIVPELDKG